MALASLILGGFEKMEEFKGTKGEWTANGLHISSAGKRSDIGQAFVKSNWEHGKLIEDTEGIANARLMASSPELLKALQNIIDACDGNNPEHAVFYFTAQSAITKALI